MPGLSRSFMVNHLFYWKNTHVLPLQGGLVGPIEAHGHFWIKNIKIKCYIYKRKCSSQCETLLHPRRSSRHVSSWAESLASDLADVIGTTLPFPSTLPPSLSRCELWLTCSLIYSQRGADDGAWLHGRGGGNGGRDGAHVISTTKHRWRELPAAVITAAPLLFPLEPSGLTQTSECQTWGTARKKLQRKREGEWRGHKPPRSTINRKKKVQQNSLFGTSFI